MSSWIAIALTIALFTLAIGIGIWLLSRWRDGARVEASKHTASEVKGWAASAIERERARSDDDALREFRRTYHDCD